MASPLLILWIDVQNNILLSGWESASTATLPSLKQGDSVQIEVHTVRSSNGGAYMVEVEIPQTSTLKMAIGRNEQKPSDGYLTVSYLGDSVQIPTSSTQTQVNTLINGLASITAAGGVVVTIVNGSTYRVSFNQIGARSDIACDAVNLRPTCSVSSRKIVTGSSTAREVQHIKPKVIPIAYNDVFVDAVEPTIIKTNPSAAITRFSISPQPKYGSFFISNGTLSTGSISISATAPEIMDALEVAGLSDFNEVPVNNVYSVIKVGPFDWDITLVSGTIETLTAYDVGLIGFKSKTGIINLNNVEVEDFLAGAASASAMLELELSDDNSVQTIYQGTILVVNDLIDYQTYSPTQLPSLINDAPTDNVLYGRKNNAWSPVILDGNNIPDYDNGITYTVGNQVYFQGKLYRMITAVGGAGYDPVAYPSYWESLSGSNPDLSGYLTKAGNLSGLSSTLDARTNIGLGRENTVYFNGIHAVNLSETKETTIVAGGINVYDIDAGYFSINPITGLRFPDGTTQTTASTTPNLSLYATLESPALTGSPTAPTPSAGDNDTSIATTAFVNTALAGATVSSTTAVLAQVRNVTGSTLTKGSVVYINGAVSNKATVALARANAESTSSQAYGIVQNDISTNNNGYVVIGGIISNINTNSFVAGTALYLSPDVAGEFTSTKPSAPNHLVYIGVVAYQHQNQGTIQLRISNGFELNELHDVAINGKTNKDLVSYEQSTNLWKNKSAATLGLAELSGANFGGSVSTSGATTTTQLSVTQTGTGKGLEILNYGSNTALYINSTGLGNRLHIAGSNSFLINRYGKVGIGYGDGSSLQESLEVGGYATCYQPSQAFAKTKNTLVATVGFVREVAVPQVITATGGSYDPYSFTNYSTVVRVSEPSDVSIQLPQDNYGAEISIGTKIVFIQVDSGRMSFFPSNGNDVQSAGGKYISKEQFSVVTAIKTDVSQWVIFGDLIATEFPPYGTLLSAGCIADSGNDALGTYYSGNWIYNGVYSDGVGGSYEAIIDYNTGGCYYPAGWVYYSNSTPSFYEWEFYGQSGSLEYGASVNSEVSDGSGGSYTDNYFDYIINDGHVIASMDDGVDNYVYRFDFATNAGIEYTYPIGGTYISEGCIIVNRTDANGIYWNNVPAIRTYYTDGYGGQYTVIEIDENNICGSMPMGYTITASNTPLTFEHLDCGGDPISQVYAVYHEEVYYSDNSNTIESATSTNYTLTQDEIFQTCPEGASDTRTWYFDGVDGYYTILELGE